MSEKDFQDKFLKIGYTKRSTGQSKTRKGRPFIGRKGIGKLALLSCAKNITILSKVKGGELVGGVINNEELDQAIKDDLNSNEYSLGTPSAEAFNQSETLLQERGTLIIFDQLNDGIRNRMEYICKLVALHFRFSLIDKEFSIYINGKLVTAKALSDLAAATEFIWTTDDFNDPFLNLCRAKEVKEVSSLRVQGDLPFSGFIASVQKPKKLQMPGLSEEKVGIDLFVNGRLREKDFFRNISSAKHVANYLYGQIHINSLDDGGSVDRFTSSREGVIGDDPYVQKYLESFGQMLKQIEKQWDEFRRKHKEDGDPDNESITRQRRKAEELINSITKDILTKEYDSLSERKVKAWVDEVRNEACHSLVAYADCFVVENLLRNYIEDSHDGATPLSFHEKAEERRKSEVNTLRGCGYTDSVRLKTTDAYYVDLSDLFVVVDPSMPRKDSIILERLRNVVAHTGGLTEKAKQDLTDEVAKVKCLLVNKLGNP